ncbi:MAG: hypothetical protein Q4F05_13790 [bacterium]|nr:hypothetical protein [bacterium]
MKCKNCNKKIFGFARECPYCKHPIESNPDAVGVYLNNVEAREKQRSARKRRKSFPLTKRTKGAVAALVGATIICTVVLHRPDDTVTITKDTIFYQSQGQLISKDLNKDGGEVVGKMTFDTSEYYFSSNLETAMLYNVEEQKKLYYVSDVKYSETGVSYSIYEKNTDNWSKKPKELVTDVTIHTWDEHGNLYYVLNNDGKLYKYDGENTVSADVGIISEMKYSKELNGLFVSIMQIDSDQVVSGSLFGQGAGNMLDDLDGEPLYTQKIAIIDTDSLVFTYQLDLPEAQYQMTKDCTKLYVLEDGILSERDLKEQTEKIIQAGVQEFSMTYDGTTDVLYYIQYNLERKVAYELYQDPLLEQDERTSKDKVLMDIEKPGEKMERINRESFRDTLKNTTVCLHKGALYSYQSGKKTLISSDVAMYSYGYYQGSKIMPIVYKSQDINWNRFVILRDVESVNQIQIGDYSSYEDETDYSTCITSWYLTDHDSNQTEMCETMVAYSSEEYVVQDSKLVQVDDDTEFLCYDSIKKVGELTYYVAKGETYTLYCKDKQGNVEEVASDIMAFQVLDDERVLILNGYEDGEEKTCYLIGQSGMQMEVAEEAERILGNSDLLWVSPSVFDENNINY